MKKILIGGIAGGVVLFIWSFLTWVILPLHEPSLHKIPNEDAAISALQSNLDEHAVYIFPKGPGPSADQASEDAWMKKMKRGPTGMIIYDPRGTDPMMPHQMVIGLILDILSAMIVVWFLSRSTALGSQFIGRVAFCSMFGIFVSIFDHLMTWNWMGFPGDFVHAMMIDAVLGWILAGVAIAALVRMPRPAVS